MDEIPATLSREAAGRTERDQLERKQQDVPPTVNDGNEMNKFFEALAESAKKFSAAFQIKVKLQMMTLMCNLEQEWLNNSNRWNKYYFVSVNLFFFFAMNELQQMDEDDRLTAEFKLDQARTALVSHF